METNGKLTFTDSKCVTQMKPTVHVRIGEGNHQLLVCNEINIRYILKGNLLYIYARSVRHIRIALIANLDMVELSYDLKLWVMIPVIVKYNFKNQATL